MQTEKLKVTGMTCGGCSHRVGSALKAINGVSGVSVSLGTGEATVEFDEKLTSPDQLKLAVQHAGYGIENATSFPKGKAGCCS